MTHADLLEVFSETVAAVRAVASADVSGGPRDLPGTDQLLTNCIGIALSWRLTAPRLMGPKSNVHLYAPLHRCERGNHHQWLPPDMKGDLGEHLHDFGFLTDVFIDRWRQGDDRAEMVAEIEAHPGHEIAYSERSGYFWDFNKLLYVMAKRRLFLACSQQDRLDQLASVLVRAHADRKHYLQPDDQLYVLLLPSAAKAWDEVRIGIGGPDGLVFRRPGEVA